MKRKLLLTFFAPAAVLFAACGQATGGGGDGSGNAPKITISDAASLAKIGVDPGYPLDGAYTLGGKPHPAKLETNRRLHRSLCRNF